MSVKIGFIGPGKMTGAIIKGIFSANYTEKENVFIYGRGKERKEYFASMGCTVCENIKEMTDNCKIIFLAVKPQNFPEIYKLITPYVSDGILFVSIAAGITFKNMQQNLGENNKFIRVMPNTPMLLGEGASAMCRTENVSDEEYNLIKEILSTCSLVEDIKEEDINAVIAVSGSSPAYIYLIAKCIADYGEKQGLKRETALKLFARTLIGSAKMLTETGYTEDELTEMVSSKGGTTIAATTVLKNSEFFPLLNEAMDACVRRAEELSGK